MLTGKVINLGICACSPAPDTLHLIRALKKEGAVVNVMLTPNARHFVSEILVQREAGTQIQVDQFELPKVYDSGHKSFAKGADLFLLCPASANTLGKAAHGIADNLLSTNLLSTRCPVMVVMHMNPAMYAKASVQRNIQFLKEEEHYIFVESDAPKPSLFPSQERIMEAVHRFFENE